MDTAVRGANLVSRLAGGPYADETPENPLTSAKLAEKFAQKAGVTDPNALKIGLISGLLFGMAVPGGWGKKAKNAAKALKSADGARNTQKAGKKVVGIGATLMTPTPQQKAAAERKLQDIISQKDKLEAAALQATAARLLEVAEKNNRPLTADIIDPTRLKKATPYLGQQIFPEDYVNALRILASEETAKAGPQATLPKALKKGAFLPGALLAAYVTNKRRD